MTTPSELLTPPEHPEGQPPLPVVVTVQPEIPTPPSLQEIEAYVNATGGSHPYPRTRDQYAQLPRTIKALLEQKVPSLAGRLGSTIEQLPAEIEAKMLRGQVEYDEEDLRALTAAGFVDVVATSRAASRDRMLTAWQEGHAQRASARQVNAEAVEAASVAERERLAQAVAAEARARHLSGRR